MSYALFAGSDFAAPLINQTVGMIVWIGLFALTIAFFVMSWTRVGQARPLVKCLVLSLFAHILLVIFFYGTEFLGIRGEPEQVDSVQISIVDDEIIPVSPVLNDLAAADIAEQYEVTASSQDIGGRPEDHAPEKIQEITPAVPTQPVKAETSVAGLDVDRTDPQGDVVAGVDDVTAMPDDLLPAEGFSELEQIDEVSPRDENAITAVSDVDPIETSEADSIVSESDDRKPDPLQRLDGSAVPDRYRQRFQNTSADRTRAVRGSRFGATRDTEAAVAAALLWLVQNQEPDGRWDASLHGSGVDRKVDGQSRSATGANADTGITGLALLALMGSGSTHLEGEYQRSVQHGLEFLLGQQDSKGSLAGNAAMFARMYCHAMATVAVCESYALTHDERLKDGVEMALAYTLNSQDRSTGGWRYQPGDAGDMSQFGWQVLALQSAGQAGMTVPEPTVNLMKKFLRSCNTGPNHGLAAYRPGFGATHAMTAESLACRMWLNSENGSKQVEEAAEYMLQRLPSSSQPDFYYWYYGSLALRQVGGEDWDRWARSLKQTLPALQRGDGSWSANTKWGGYGGMVYSTAMGALCLESFYRYQ